MSDMRSLFLLFFANFAPLKKSLFSLAKLAKKIVFFNNDTDANN